LRGIRQHCVPKAPQQAAPSDARRRNASMPIRVAAAGKEFLDLAAGRSCRRKYRLLVLVNSMKS